MYKPLDDRQVVNRAILQQLFPWVGEQTLDILMASVNAEVTPPLSVTATSSPSLTVNVGPAIVSNPESNRNHSISPINGVLPIFTSGTVTFPSASGGNITTSTGGSYPLTLPLNDYVQILLSLDQTGHLIINIGTPSPIEADAVIPGPTANTSSFAYITLFNNAGTIENVTQSNIYQLAAGGGSSSSSSSNPFWIAKKVSLTNNTTSISVSFPNPQPDTSYIVLGVMGNTTDAFPQYQQLEITNKSESGFVFNWSHPLDSSNYFVSYVIPPKTISVAEVPIGSGSNSLSATLPIAQSGSGYGVIVELQNTIDANPQFQTTVIGTNTSNAINLKWNAPTDTANYIATYMIGATGQTAISNGVTSITVSLPVNYNTANYAAIGSMQNMVDSHPRFQPLLITAQNGNSITFSWNAITDTANYLLNYYTISATS